MAESTTQKRVKVMRDSGPKLGFVEDPTHTPWSVVEADTRETVRWEVIVYAPEACDEDLPLIFESRQDAIAWVETNDCAKDDDWSFLREPETTATQSSAVTEQRSHDTLILCSDFGGGGERFVVPPGGIEDWAGRRPASANIPDWTPKSYESTGRSDMTGQEAQESPGSRRLRVRKAWTDDLPFSNLTSASNVE